MLQLVRTTSENTDFRSLVALLDQHLRVLDGDDHAFYAQFNKIDALRQVVVAYLDDEPIGCGAIKPYSEDTAEVKRMFVDLNHRGHGIAGKILADLESWAGELNFSYCILETGYNQPEAIRLYEKSGYEVIPNYGQYVGVENSVCMKKRVA